MYWSMCWDELTNALYWPYGAQILLNGVHFFLPICPLNYMSAKNFNEKNVEFEPICCVDCREMIATPSHLSSRMLIKVTQPFVWLCCQTWCLMSITIINKTLHFIPVFSLAEFCIQWFTMERRREETGQAHSSMMSLVIRKNSQTHFKSTLGLAATISSVNGLVWMWHLQYVHLPSFSGRQRHS